MPGLGISTGIPFRSGSDSSWTPPADGHNIRIIDPSDLTTVTKDTWNYISEIRDKGSVSSALVQATDLAKPHWTPSGLYGDGIEDYLKSSADTANQPTFIYVVFRPKAWYSLDTLFDGLTLNSGRVYQYTGNPKLKGSAGTSSADVTGATLEGWHVLRILFNGANSRATLDANTPVTGNFGAANMGGLTLFAEGDNGHLINADIRYVLIRDSADNAAIETGIYNGLKNTYAKDAPADQFSSGICVFSFDNGNKSFLDNAVPLFQSRSKLCTSYINGGIIGVNDPLGVLNMTWAEIKSCYDLGFDMQCHGKTHAAFSALTNDQLIAELVYNDAQFILNGMEPPKHTGYPEVFTMTQAVLQTMRIYRDSARVFMSTESVQDDPFNYVWKGTDRYLMKELHIDGVNATAVADAKAAIDYCISHKCAVFFTGHDVQDSGGTYSTTIANLTEILDYAISSGISILTHSQIAPLLSDRPTPFTPYSNQYLPVLSAHTTKPIDAVKVAQNAFLNTIYAGGVYQKLDRLIVFATNVNTAGEEKIEWILPTRTITKNSTPAFTAFQGVSNGSTGRFYATDFNPSSGTNKYLLNDCSFGLYCRTTRAAADMIAMGASVIGGGVGHEAAIELRYTGDLLMVKCNETTWKSIANTDCKGMYVVSRLASTGFTIYKNKAGTLVTQDSIAMPSSPFNILCSVNQVNGLPVIADTGAEIAMSFIGGGLTQADVDCLTDAFEVYMDSNGKGVIT